MNTNRKLARVVTSARSQLSMSESGLFGFWMSLPSLVYVLLVIGFPTVYLVYLATTRNAASIIRPTEFVGLGNVVAVLNSSSFWQALVNTFIYAVAVVGGGLVLQLGIALSLNADLPYRRFWQTLVILPWAVPFVLSTLMWRLMFNPQFGLINYLLTRLGLAPVQWFSSQVTAFTTVIVTTIWINTPLSVLILLTGLQLIPDEMYEAARLDGAGIWARFRHVTLPLLRPAIMTVVLLQSLLALRGFDIIFAMTSGGPGNATTVIAIDVFNNLIRFGNTGFAAAESLILVLMIFVVLGVLLKLAGSDDYEVNV